MGSRFRLDGELYALEGVIKEIKHSGDATWEDGHVVIEVEEEDTMPLEVACLNWGVEMEDA